MYPKTSFSKCHFKNPIIKVVILCDLIVKCDLKKKKKTPKSMDLGYIDFFVNLIFSNINK